VVALLLGVACTASSDEQPQLDAVAADVDARLREVAAAAQARAVTLAEMPRLMLAVATDRATVRDLTVDELAFRPRPFEAIEIGQVPKGGKPVSLLRLPESATFEAPLSEPGVHLIVVGPQLFVSAVVNVQPRERADELRGVVAVSSLVDLRAIAQRIDAPGLAARLETGRGGVQLSQAPLAEGARRVEIPLQSEAARGARLVLVAPPPNRSSLQLPIALAALLLGGAVAAALFAWRRRRPALPRMALQSSEPALPLATALAAGGAAANGSAAEHVTSGALPKVPTFLTEPTPEPRAPEAADGHPEELARLDDMFDLVHAKEGSGLISLQMLKPTSGDDESLDRNRKPTPVDPANTLKAESHDEYAEIFARFTEARELLGEQGRISYQKFISRLSHDRAELIERYSLKDVRFQIYVKDGRARLRPIGVRR
jgi:hypothetical protein